jgi:hypothetical protein
VSEDAYASRGVGYNELHTAAEERERFETERASSSSFEHEGRTPYWAKGKGRSEDEEEGEGDDMTWEPPPTAEQVKRRRASGEAQYQTPSGHHRRHSRGEGRPVSSLDARRIRMLWWREAGINVLFILAW